MFRHHRILYRRLLRGQSSEDLMALRADSSLFPTLLTLIEDELRRREEAANAPNSRDSSGLRPFIAPSRAPALS